MIQMSVANQNVVNTGLFLNTQLCRDASGINNHLLVDQQTACLLPGNS